MDFNSNDNDQTVIVPQDAYGDMPPQMMNDMYAQSQQMPNNYQAPQTADMYSQGQQMYSQQQSQQMYNQQPQQPQFNTYGQQPQFNTYGQQPQFNTYGQQPQPKTPSTPPKKKKTGLIVGIIIAIILIAGGICAALLIPKMKAKKEKKAAQKPIETYFDGYAKYDLDAAGKALYPSYSNKWTGSIYVSAGATNNAGYWANEREVFGSDPVITYEITDTVKVKNINDIETSIKAQFDESIDIDKAYSYTVEESYVGENGKVVLEETLITGKVDGKWYLVYAITNDILTNTLSEPDPVTTEDPFIDDPTTEEPDTEAPTTEEPTTQAQIEPEGDWDWDAMPFYFDGKFYEINKMTYDDIVAMGFELDDEYLDQELEDYEYTFSESAKASDGSYIYVRFKNFTGNGTRKVRDCEILGITFPMGYTKNEFIVKLNNGITKGMTSSQCKNIMGEGDEYLSDDGTYGSITYESDDNAYANTVKLSFSDDQLTEILIENFD